MASIILLVEKTCDKYKNQPQFKKILETSKRIKDFLSERIFWASVLSAAIHSYLKFSISGFISLKSTEFKDPSALVIFALYLIGFPVFVAIYVTKNQNQI
jgi:hypothetical protein